jgi:thioredoxin reductase
MIFDVIIAGGGPAGLSAALILGRCRRRVLLCDAGAPRNARSHGLHGYLTRDGIEPLDFLRIARDQLRPYDTVEIRDVAVEKIVRERDRFRVRLADGRRATSRRVLIATGVLDELPDIPGFAELYGTSVFHCPYCDGWEMRDQPLAVYGRGKRGYGLALELTLWSRDVVLCTDGPPGLSADKRERLARNGVALRTQRIARLEGSGEVLERVVFADGSALPRRGLFFNTGQQQRCGLAAEVGCEFSKKGAVKTGKHESTCVPGVFVCGDASKDVQWVIVAAAEGAAAAFAINTALLKDDLA